MGFHYHKLNFKTSKNTSIKQKKTNKEGDCDIAWIWDRMIAIEEKLEQLKAQLE